MCMCVLWLLGMRMKLVKKLVGSILLPHFTLFQIAQNRLITYISVLTNRKEEEEDHLEEYLLPPISQFVHV